MYIVKLLAVYVCKAENLLIYSIFSNFLLLWKNYALWFHATLLRVSDLFSGFCKCTYHVIYCPEIEDSHFHVYSSDKWWECNCVFKQT